MREEYIMIKPPHHPVHLYLTLSHRCSSLQPPLPPSLIDSPPSFPSILPSSITHIIHSSHSLISTPILPLPSRLPYLSPSFIHSFPALIFIHTYSHFQAHSSLFSFIVSLTFLPPIPSFTHFLCLFCPFPLYSLYPSFLPSLIHTIIHTFTYSSAHSLP